MHHDLDHKAEAIFHEAADMPRDRRDAYLNERCGSDLVLRQRVDALLRNQHFELESPVVPRLRDHPFSPLESGACIGPYQVVSVLGEGGMGIVYEAENTHTQQRVALKLVRPGLATPLLLQRLEYEFRTLARLEHPGIARMNHADTADIGAARQPYIAMELVHGENVILHAARQKFTIRQRLELAATIADAVHYAHQRGVIHRDLKPANILVTDDGQPKILDFGVARVTDSDAQRTTFQTSIGQFMGTPQYMSPEQAGGDPALVATTSDVYALGVLMYELLTGRLPYRCENKTVPEALQIVREQEPLRPSTINKTLRGDIETIILKALEKEKGRRYASASELAADIRRYLKDEPITARPASAVYQLRKFARRHRAAVISVAAVFLVSVATAITVWQTKSATKAKLNAEFLNRLVLSTFAKANPRVHPAAAPPTPAQLLQFTVEEIDNAAVRPDPELEATARLAIGNALHALGELGPSHSQLRQALQLRKNALGNEHEDVAAALNDLASVLVDQTDYAAAEPLYREALRLHRKLLGRQDPKVVTSLSNLAFLLQQMGRYSESDALYQEALLIAERNPQARREVLYALGNLGLQRQEEGRYAEATTLLTNALELSRATLGNDHPDVLKARGNVAALAELTGQSAAAEREFTLLLQDSRRILGKTHPDTLALMHNLSSVLIKLERYDEAELLLRETIDLGGRALGAAHLDVVASMRELALVYLARSRLEKAEELLTAGLARCRESLGERHPRTLTMMADLADLFVTKGDFAQAEQMMNQVIDGRRALLGAEHPDTLSALNNLAYLHLAAGDRDKAEPLCAEILEIRTRLFGAAHPDTLTATHNLAGALEKRDRPRAEQLYKVALEGRRAALPPDHLDIASSLNNLANLIDDDPARLEEAEQLHRQALEIRRTKLGHDSLDTAQSLANLAGVRAQRGSLADAELLRTQALEIRRKRLGARHALTLDSMNALAGTFVAESRFADAEPLYREVLAAVRDSAPSQRRLLIAIAGLCDILLKQERDQALIEAEQLARECVQLSEQGLPENDWLRLAVQSLLGGALVAQTVDKSMPDQVRLAKLREAEPLLLAAAQRISPPGNARIRKREALERVVRLYDEWHKLDREGGFDAKADHWRQQLATWQSAINHAEPAGRASEAPAQAPSVVGPAGGG